MFCRVSIVTVNHDPSHRPINHAVDAVTSRATPNPATSPEEWARQLVDCYGPLVGGRELRGLLGFKTAPALQRAIRMQLLGAPLFRIKGRRGVFALTAEIASWLLEERRSAISRGKPAKEVDMDG